MTALSLRWACPQCRLSLLSITPERLHCPQCCRHYDRVDGIWRLLSAEKSDAYRLFVENYDKVRRDEQWGDSANGNYYRALPFRDLSGLHPNIWQIRAASFEALLRTVVEPLARELAKPLRILDAGAGNGWLSYRLALKGHQVVASDLRLDAYDGLGACHWYRDAVCIDVVQATFEEIPLCEGEIDLVIFGGSFHYASSYRQTLEEALRVLQRNGHIAIIDSPVYKNERSGEQMVDELYKQLADAHQIDPQVIDHENYLTPGRLAELGKQLQIKWRMVEPFYGWRWFMAPWLAKLRRRREPARFYVISGQRIP